MNHILKEMEKALEGNKTLEKLTLSDYNDNEMYETCDDVTLPKEFCRHLMIGIGLNTSLSEVHLNFAHFNWNCPKNGRLVYVSHMLCDSFGSSV